ncbi:PRA1 family protein [Melia azedarach]|uniref:PRA1 family protein n=1 Tax=Melia azedarach TaxID=155640 RepID=A0ACC1XEC4_MELAZ|nr:PRA1 family protein [Melia azedarach]
MTTYGTIPTETPASSNQSLLESVKQQIQLCFGTQRPWNDMFQIHSFSLPTSFGNVTERIRTNVAFFRMNYTLITLFIVFISFLWNPLSLIVLIVMTVAWLFLYFLRDHDRLTFFGYEIDDRILMIVLLLATVAVLFLTDVTRNIIIGLSIGMVVICVHGALTTPDDHMLSADDEERLGSAAPQGKRVKPLPLKNAASSSFSSSS